MGSTEGDTLVSKIPVKTDVPLKAARHGDAARENRDRTTEATANFNSSI